jgi:hypothetical protein
MLFMENNLSAQSRRHLCLNDLPAQSRRHLCLNDLPAQSHKLETNLCDLPNDILRLLINRDSFSYWRLCATCRRFAGLGKESSLINRKKFLIPIETYYRGCIQYTILPNGKIEGEYINKIDDNSIWIKCIFINNYVIYFEEFVKGSGKIAMTWPNDVNIYFPYNLQELTSSLSSYNHNGSSYKSFWGKLYPI